MERLTRGQAWSSEAAQLVEKVELNRRYVGDGQLRKEKKTTTSTPSVGLKEPPKGGRRSE
jgi:hypothetical protein